MKYECKICGIMQFEKQLDDDYLMEICKDCACEHDVLTFKEFQDTKKKVNHDKWESIYGFDSNVGDHFYVYGQDGDFGYIEINDCNGGNSLKYFMQISNWDGLTDELEHFEKRLYTDHYLCNI